MLIILKLFWDEGIKAFVQTFTENPQTYSMNYLHMWEGGWGVSTSWENHTANLVHTIN